MTWITGPSGRSYQLAHDFTGNVKAESVSVDTGNPEGWQTVGDVEIPFEDMKHIVLQYLRAQAVHVLEKADDATLEKFFTTWSTP